MWVEGPIAVLFCDVVTSVTFLFCDVVGTEELELQGQAVGGFSGRLGVVFEVYNIMRCIDKVHGHKHFPRIG